MPDDENRIDVFGPYFQSFGAMHSSVLDFVRNTPTANSKTEMHLLQCNFLEYVSEDHDNGYQWYKACFDNCLDKSFAIGINKQRIFAQTDNQKHLLDTIQNSWNKSLGVHPKIINEITRVRDLNKENHEMILSVHFWFDGKYRSDEIEDTQYCKIVYTHEAISSYLERIRLTTASS